MRAMAPPMTARSTRCGASAPIEAPTSSTIDSPRRSATAPRSPAARCPACILQIEFGHRHQRAGIAGRDRDVGFALLDRVDRKPHRGLAAALAQRLARLVVHRAPRYRRVHAGATPLAAPDASPTAVPPARLPEEQTTRLSGWRASASSAPAIDHGRRHGLPPSRREQCEPFATYLTAILDLDPTCHARIAVPISCRRMIPSEEPRPRFGIMLQDRIEGR